MTSPRTQWPGCRAPRTVRLSRGKLSFTSCTQTAATLYAESATGNCYVYLATPEGGSGAKAMAKSNRRKKQDRARVDSRHAAEARRKAEDVQRRDRAEAKQHADGLFDRATDMALAPAALAALIMDELADSTGAGVIAHARLRNGAEPATLAEAARLLIAACPGADRADGLPPGVLAFAAVAAHAIGDEAEEARHTEALLDLARAFDDEAPMQVVGDVLWWTHPLEAAEMFRRYVLNNPVSRIFATFFVQPSARAELIESGWTDLEAWDGLGDPSDPGFAQRVAERALQPWEPDPEVQVWYQGRAGIAIEFRRRQSMPRGNQNADQ
jgi:hypothetical protein